MHVVSVPTQFRGDPGERQRRFGGAEDIFAFLATPLSREGRAVNQRWVDEERARAEQKCLLCWGLDDLTGRDWLARRDGRNHDAGCL